MNCIKMNKTSVLDKKQTEIHFFGCGTHMKSGGKFSVGEDRTKMKELLCETRAGANETVKCDTHL